MATTATARQPPGTFLRLLSVVIASIAIALVALTIAQWRPDDAATPAPGDVVDEFLAASQALDLDAATATFEGDATITDSTGNSTRGTDAATRLIERYDGFEAGPRQVTGNEVVWTEALPIRTPDNRQFQHDVRPELSAEVPYYDSVQAMCAVVANGKIHAVVTLDLDSQRSCHGAKPSPSMNAVFMLAVTATLVPMWLFVRGFAAQPPRSRRQFIQALAASHGETSPWPTRPASVA
jgi:hypothetical protein